MKYRISNGPILGLLCLLSACDTANLETGDDSPLDSSDTSESETEQSTDMEEFAAVFASDTEDEASALFRPDRITEVRLTLPFDVWEQLIVDAQDEIYTAADVAVDGEELGEVGLRFKGSYGSLYGCFEEGELVCDKLPMKIKFNEYDDEKRYKGLKRINLHPYRWGEARFFYDYFSYKLYRGMGIPTARSGFAEVWVNDELLGLFGLVEQIDGRFTAGRFVEGNGNLYKEPQLEIADFDLDESLRTNEEAPDHSVFEKFAKELKAADDASLPTVLSKWMNTTYLMRYMAVDDAIFNWDGITAFYCDETLGCINHNFYLYQEESKERFWLIPWDMDSTFDPNNWLALPPWNDLSVDCEEMKTVETAGVPVRPACGNPLLRAIALRQLSTDQYRQAVRKLLDEVFDVDALLDEGQLIADTLAPSVEADPDRYSARWVNGYKEFRTALKNARYATEKRLGAIPGIK